MHSRKTSMLRGRRVRATRLDPNGRPVYGDEQVSVSKGFVSISMTSNIEEGEPVSQPNASGEQCISETATPSFTGIGVEIVFCEVDFAFFETLTGQEVVTNEDGVAVGITESTDVDLSAVAFALEMWTDAKMVDGLASAGSQGQFGYVLLPFLGGGVIGDVTIENAAITFTVNSMTTKGGNGWGAGPYDVELVGGSPSKLYKPLKRNDHRRIMHTEVAPPEPYDGARPLLDPSAAELTGITAAAGVGTNEVTIEPTPAGTDPVMYEFGDGTWDYAETGSYVHTYADPGTYTIVGYRGSSSATAAVTVPGA